MSLAVERLARAFTVLSFVLLCWVAQRSTEVRSDCVSSSFLSFVQIDGQRVPNCLFEGRLSTRNWTKPLTAGQKIILRKLEVLSPLKQLFAEQAMGLAVDISERDPELFELGRGYVRLGKKWLDDPTQLRRALIMGVLRNQFPETYTNHFQLEVVADFILLSVFSVDEWKGEDGKVYSLVRDVRFSTVAPTFEQYCLSPFRSLSHRTACRLEGGAEVEQANVWGLRPLLAVSLWRAMEKLPLGEQWLVLRAIAAGKGLPPLVDLAQINADNVVSWFTKSLHETLSAWLPKKSGGEWAIKRTLKELEVESPTRWELTLDLTATPVWREIMEQMRQRAQFRKERVLIFTPEGARALPSGLPVAWAADEISSQKHVLIACDWPAPEETVHVRARHLFAQQSCEKLKRPFWD